MEHAYRCVKPGNFVKWSVILILSMLFAGTNVTWTWVNKDHNVNPLTMTDYDNCIINNGTAFSGDYVWTAPTVITEPSQKFYFACGRYWNETLGYGEHCHDGGMKAMIKVSNHCLKI